MLNEIINIVSNNPLVAISTLIGAFSLLIAFLTFSENRRSSRAKQMPIIKIDYDRSIRKFKAINTGPGLAINIQIDDFYFFVEDYCFYLKFSKIFNLEPGKDIIISIEQGVNGKQLEDGPLAAHLYSRYSERNYIFTVEFKDIGGNIYYEKVSMGRDGLFIMKYEMTWWFSRLNYRVDQKTRHFWFILESLLIGMRNRIIRKRNASPNP